MVEFGRQLPDIRTVVPGPKSVAAMDQLARFECPAITARRGRRRDDGGRDPIVWAEARGANVRDVDGNRYVDLSGGFAVASVGHAHPEVVAAGQRQLATMPHAMGDLFPADVKIRLAARLADLAPGSLTQCIFGSDGSDAVEAAIKTARVATGRHRILGFEGGYHGMTLGALGVSGYRDSFRAPFLDSAGRGDIRLPWPGTGAFEDGDTVLAYIAQLLGSHAMGCGDIAALMIEPVQGRAGCRIPPPGFLSGLRELCTRHGVMLIFDEIYTGFGRTGTRFACEHSDVVPDILCIGKAMGGGFPISACLASEEVMQGWGRSKGEAVHTSTFLGNPTGCAMALAAIEVIERDALSARSAELGERALNALRGGLADNAMVSDVRGCGLMIGIELADGDDTGLAVRAMFDLLAQGFIVTPGGVAGNTITLAPPLNIDATLLDAGLQTIIRGL